MLRSMARSDHILAEATARVQALSKSLPAQVDAASLSLTSKLPLKALAYREACLWRCEELARSAVNSFREGSTVSGIILTRAFTETAAGVWYLLELINRQLDNAVESDLDERLMRLLMGHKGEEGMPESVNVMTFIDRMNRRIPGLRRAYDRMSEYAHPNWPGTGSAYSEIDRESMITHFGRRQNFEAHRVLGLSCLNGGLGLLEFAYNQLSDRFPAFITACEKSLEEKSG